MAGPSSPRAALELFPRPPYRLDLTAWALRRRARNRVDRWDGSYRRTLLIADRAVPVRVEQSGAVEGPVLRIDLGPQDRWRASDQAELIRQLTGLLGVDVDLQDFYAVADHHAITAPLKDRLLGLRPPRFPTLFEAMVNAVANQQLSLEVGLTLLNRITDTFGIAPAEVGEPNAFPSPEALLRASPADLRALGFSGRKAEYLLGIAHGIATGAIEEEALRSADRREAVKKLVAVRGIGRWSAEYVLLRGLGRLDVFPGDDVGARNKLQRFMGLDHAPDYDEIGERLLPWQPWAGMLYFHLLLDGLVERGELVL